MVLNQKLKIKFVTKKVEAEPVTLSCTKKRDSSSVIEVQKAKRQKMDRNVTQQCAAILKKLMTHQAGWVFNQPVDPVALNIPDYFSIISKPMDLGTIKSKLEKNMYLGTEDFADDVRLTFANAMLYNPPSNNVHQMAKKLNEIFNTRWKTLEPKWSSQGSKAEQGQILSGGLTKTTPISKQSCNTMPSSWANLLPKKSMPSEDKQKLRKELLEVTRGKMPPQLRGFLRAHGITCQSEDRMGVNIDQLDEATLWELRRVVRISHVTRSENVDHSKTTPNCRTKSFGKDLQKDNGSDNACACDSGNSELPLSPTASKCGSSSFQCNLQNEELKNGASSDLSTERSLAKDYHACSSDASEMSCQGKNTMPRVSKSDLDSDGAVSAVDDETICPSSHPLASTTEAADKEWPIPIFDVQLSPKKALRAAMLKTRFADTILKAQQKTLLNHVDKADLVKIQREKERLERKQCEEKARIEAEIRAAEALSRQRAEIELKLQREKEREAARVALQKMERSVEIDDNLKIVKDLEKLSGCALSYCYFRHTHSKVLLGTANFRNPLERLGLYMKDDFLDDDEETILNGDGEEGEIF